MPARSRIAVGALAAVVLAGGCENDFVEVCTPTSVEIVEATGAVLEAQLRAGDRPLRAKALRFRVGTAEGVVETGGDGRARIDPGGASVGSGVVVGFPGDDAYCESGETGTIGTVGADQP